MKFRLFIRETRFFQIMAVLGVLSLAAATGTALVWAGEDEHPTSQLEHALVETATYIGEDSAYDWALDHLLSQYITSKDPRVLFMNIDPEALGLVGRFAALGGISGGPYRITMSDGARRVAVIADGTSPIFGVRPDGTAIRSTQTCFVFHRPEGVNSSYSVPTEVAILSCKLGSRIKREAARAPSYPGYQPLTASAKRLLSSAMGVSWSRSAILPSNSPRNDFGGDQQISQSLRFRFVNQERNLELCRYAKYATSNSSGSSGGCYENDEALDVGRLEFRVTPHGKFEYVVFLTGPDWAWYQSARKAEMPVFPVRAFEARSLEDVRHLSLNPSRCYAIFGCKEDEPGRSFVGEWGSLEAEDVQFQTLILRLDPEDDTTMEFELHQTGPSVPSYSLKLSREE